MSTKQTEAQIGQGEPVAWKWRNIKTDSEGVHLEDPKTVGIDVTHPAYEWTPLYTHPEPQQNPLTDEQIDDGRVMTVVYRNVQMADVQSFMDHPKAVWFGWCHAPYQRDDALYKLNKAVAAKKPLTDEQQIAEALRKHGFALVKTATGYDVMKLGPCIAHNIGEKK